MVGIVAVKVSGCNVSGLGSTIVGELAVADMEMLPVTPLATMPVTVNTSDPPPPRLNELVVSVPVVSEPLAGQTAVPLAVHVQLRPAELNCDFVHGIWSVMFVAEFVP